MFVDNKRWNKELFNKVYNNSRGINLNIKDTLSVNSTKKEVEVIEEVVPKAVPVVKPKVKVKPEVIVEPEIVNVVNKTITKQPKIVKLENKVEKVSWWRKILNWFI